MEFIDKLLHKHYYKSGRKKLQTILISLMMILAISILLIDFYSSFVHQYYVMCIIEGLVICIFCLSYILFPKVLSIKYVIYNTLGALGGLLVLSLNIPGENYYFTLFWLATFPIYLFFFLGLYQGAIWTIYIIISLIVTTINSIFIWFPPLYHFDFLIQLTIGYSAISYLVYVLEKERLQYEINLNNAINQKEILLKEVHHRTKNNIQIMIALLETQSFKIDNKQCKKIFQNHAQRLKSIGLIHEHLYKYNDYEQVALDTYLQEITRYLQSITQHDIKIDFEHFIIDIKLAMHLGLVYNELLSNAIEHAYPEQNGIIHVSLVKKNTECILSIQDDGIGFDITKEYNTLGLHLISDISKHLHSTKSLDIDTTNGTKIIIYCEMKG